MRLLELFSGTGSVGRAFRSRGWEVTSLDLNPKARPTICCDILAWQYREAFKPGHFDAVWASPVCTEFSMALRHRPRNLPAGDAMVLKALEIIDYLRPRWWALENPATGLLKTREYMAGLPCHDVTYCKFGYPYRKPTRIWGNLPWTPSRGVCRKGDRCDVPTIAGIMSLSVTHTMALHVFLVRF